jgi:phosphate-selective porin OprO/OprP
MVKGIRTTVFVVASSLAAAVSASAQTEPLAPGAREQAIERERERGVRFEFDGQPSIRVDGLLRLDVRLISQGDWRDLSSQEIDTDTEFDLQRLRVGIDGVLLRRLEYQVEREMRDPRDPWRDAFVNLRLSRAVEVQAGHFKLPFSLEQTTGSKGLDFTDRSLAASYLAPGRDVGVMVHGSTRGSTLSYEAGMFRRGGKAPLLRDDPGDASPRTVAGRLVLRPWLPSTPKPLRALSLGVAATAGRVPEGLNGMRGRTLAEDVFFDRVYVSGLRRRVGVEAQWRMGPVSAQGEVIRVRDERKHQGIDDQDLPDALSRGWYLSGTWLLTGERKKGTIEPTRRLSRRGFGALELAGRFESLGFGSDVTDGVPSRGPRAPRVVEKSDSVLTTGVNWYLNEFLKVQADLAREVRRDEGRVLDNGGRLWNRTLRVQFTL